MKSDDFSGALQIRMLADGTEATCQRCDQASDHRHAECCAGCRLFQTSRHEAIKVVLYAALSRTKGAKVELEQRASADRGPDRTDLRMDRKLAPEGGVLDIDIAVITSGSLACRGAAQRADTATNLVTDGHHGRLARVQEAIEGELRKAAVEKTAKYAEHVPGRFMAFIISNGGLPDSSAETLLRYWAKVVPGGRRQQGHSASPSSHSAPGQRPREDDRTGTETVIADKVTVIQLLIISAFYTASTFPQ